MMMSNNMMSFGLQDLWSFPLTSSTPKPGLDEDLFSGLDSESNTSGDSQSLGNSASSGGEEIQSPPLQSRTVSFLNHNWINDINNNNSSSSNDNNKATTCTASSSTTKTSETAKKTSQIKSLEKIAKATSPDKHQKPTESYISLISKVILAAPEKRLLLGDIYSAIMERYPFYQHTEDKAWKNSIRHNLSLNECFIKNGRADNGKGNFWSIHPACVDDFRKGDFRRRQARRRAKRSQSNQAGGATVGQSLQHVSPYAPYGYSHGYHHPQINSYGLMNQYYQQAGPVITPHQQTPSAVITSHHQQQQQTSPVMTQQHNAPVLPPTSQTARAQMTAPTYNTAPGMLPFGSTHVPSTLASGMIPLRPAPSALPSAPLPTPAVPSYAGYLQSHSSQATTAPPNVTSTQLYSSGTPLYPAPAASHGVYGPMTSSLYPARPTPYSLGNAL